MAAWKPQSVGSKVPKALIDAHLHRVCLQIQLAPNQNSGNPRISQPKHPLSSALCHHADVFEFCLRKPFLALRAPTAGPSPSTARASPPLPWVLNAKRLLLERKVRPHVMVLGCFSSGFIVPCWSFRVDLLVVSNGSFPVVCCNVPQLLWLYCRLIHWVVVAAC